jgi:hypothetical protein
MNKTYNITIYGVDSELETLEEFIEEAIADGDETYLNHILAEKEFFVNLGDSKEVATLEEYFTLLEEIGSHTDNQYRIYNNGTVISLND